MVSIPGMNMVAVPPLGTTGGRPRKEALYDREVYPDDTTLATEKKVFSNFSQFADAAVTPAATKQEGRDTNLAGSGSVGLPNGHLFHWYEWRHALTPLGSNVATNANKGVLEEIHRAISLSYCEFRFTQTVLITCPMAELPAGTGPAWGSTSQNDTVALGPNCVPNRQGKVIAINQNPIVIRGLQQFQISNKTPELGFTPTVDLFTLHVLDGILVRAITG